MADVSVTTIAPAWGFRGTNGTKLTITGTNFGSPQGGGSVDIGGKAAAIVSWAATSIVCRAAKDTPVGDQTVTVTDGSTSDTGTVEILESQDASAVHDGTTRPRVVPSGTDGHWPEVIGPVGEWAVSGSATGTVTVKKDGATGQSHYITDVIFGNGGITKPLQVTIKSGDAILLDVLGGPPAGAGPSMMHWPLRAPLKCAAGDDAIVIVTETAEGTGTCYANLMGFTR